MAKKSQEKKISIIACGGFGQNTLLSTMKRSFFPLLEKDIAMFAFDTSTRNLQKYEDEGVIDKVSVHLVPKADGSGAFRGKNNVAINKMVNEVVQSGIIPPGLTIVIASASGGSGAVAACDTIEALLRQGRDVLGMFLETDEDNTKVNNTLKTVKTLRAKAAAGTSHFNVYWAHNRNEQGRVEKAVADRVFQEALENLIAIGHPRMGKLDGSDINSFLQHPVNASTPGEVRFIQIRQRSKDEFFDENEEVPLAILSLLVDEETDQDLPRGVDHSTHGILPKELDFTDGRVETQFVISGGKLAKLANRLESTIGEYGTIRQEANKAQAGNEIRVNKNEVISDDNTFI